MDKIISAVKKIPLFEGFDSKDLEQVMTCLSAKHIYFKKNELILIAERWPKYIGLLTSGGLKITKDDENGNSPIITHIQAPSIFAEIWVWAGMEHCPITAQASEDSEVVFLDSSKIVLICPTACYFHRKLMESMLRSIAAKAAMLDKKVELLSKRTIREKIICFFNSQRGNAKKFTIPYKREEMARHLSVDRSALSNELGKMRDEGLIKFDRNEFEIL